MGGESNQKLANSKHFGLIVMTSYIMSYMDLILLFVLL